MKIVDNYLPQKVFEQIQKQVTDYNFPWYYNDNVALKTTNEFNKNHWFLYHTFYIDYSPNSNFFSTIVPVIESLDAKAIIRVKANMYPQTEKLTVHEKHRDYDFEHKGALLYINTNNGYTIVENEKVESVANRMLFFDTNKLHQSTTCTDAKVRLNINFNYL